MKLLGLIHNIFFWQSLIRDIHFTLVGCSFIRTRVCNILRQHEMHPMTELQIFRRRWKDEMRESQSQWYGRSFFWVFFMKFWLFMSYNDIFVTFVHFHIFYDIWIVFDFAYFKFEFILKMIEWMDERMNRWKWLK